MVKKQMERIRNKGQYRSIRYLETAQGVRATIGGKRYMIFSSNNYLGLCNDKRLKTVALDAIEEYGVGTGGSRLITGSNILHRELEEKIARFKNREAAIIYSSGYMANIGVISSLTDSSWTIFCDRLNHASIIDGIRLSGAKLIPYKHADMKDLEFKLKRYGSKNNLIVTDGVFSMDGDIADLNYLIELAKKYGSMTMVDDAHGTGVLGIAGRGTEEHLGLEGQVDICVGTMSKALGGEGGFVAGSWDLIDYLKQSSRSFIYSTSLAPVTTAVAIEAIEIATSYSKQRAELRDKSQYLRLELKKLGLDVVGGETPIIPIIIGEEKVALRYSSKLMEEGIYIPCIRPPTVPKGSSRLRVTITTEHSYGDLACLLEALYSVGRDMGRI